MIKLYPTNEWTEEMGDCLFFCFVTFDEPPEVYVGCPLDSGFQEYEGMFGLEWSHFIKLDFNEIFDQARGLSRH